MTKLEVAFFSFIVLSLIFLGLIISDRFEKRDEFKKGCVKTDYYSVTNGGQFRVVYDCSEAVKDES